jgi:hypothetical protein
VNAQRTLDQINDGWKALWNGIPDSKRRAWVMLSHGIGSTE